mgnify:CR=1 FL=1
MRIRNFLLLISIAMFLMAGSAQARNQIRVVGSSTVYPFSSYVAEEFGATTDYSTPVVEATGTGGGMKLFSQGNGLGTPDISNASRKMKLSEYKRCLKNGVKEITEVIFGYDGIVFAHNNKNPELDLTREQIVLALAAEVPQEGELVDNPYQYWDQIDSDLPHREILVYGPPTTSGTRDAFEELVMEDATKHMDGYGGKYTKVRTDGKYVPSGENDNLIVKRLERNKDAIGIFGYSFLEQNSGTIQAAQIEGVKPVPEKISQGKYPVARSLFFYVKRSHLDKVDGLREYIDLFLSEKMIGNYGYLKSIGLVPLPKEKRKEMRQRVENGVTLQKSDFK